MNAWIVFYIVLCAIVLCTQLFALFLLKRDQNFRVNQKYLMGALCCTEIVLLIQFAMRAVRLTNQSFGINLIVHFGGLAGGLMYIFVMTIITVDRFAEIKFNLKYPLYCSTKRAIAILILAFTISCLFYVGVLTISIINGNKFSWDKLLICYFLPIFQATFLVIAFVAYCYIFKKLRKNSLALNKICNQLDQNSLQKGPRKKIQVKSKVIVPALIVLTFILLSILPNYISIYYISTNFRYEVTFKLFSSLYLFGWMADPIIYIFSVKSIRQIIRSFTKFLT